jgi:long-chain fatty acid transport protein
MVENSLSGSGEARGGGLPRATRQRPFPLSAQSTLLTTRLQRTQNCPVSGTFVTEASLSALNLQPTLAYPVTEWLSLGVGASVIYAWMDLSLRTGSELGSLPPSPAAPAPTVKVNDADDWGAAAVVSALAKWGDHTRFGFLYRSKVEISLDGDVEGTALPGIKFKGDMDFAEGINLSVAHVLNETVTLYADTGWSNWSQYSDQAWTFSGDLRGISLDIDRDRKDTWRLGVGAEWQAMEKLMLQGGFSYDSSPVKDSKRLPDIPVGEAYRFSVGQRFTPVEHIEIFASYTGMWSGDPDVDNVTLPNGTVLNGEYQPSWIHFVTMGIHVDF